MFDSVTVEYSVISLIYSRTFLFSRLKKMLDLKWVSNVDLLNIYDGGG